MAERMEERGQDESSRFSVGRRKVKGRSGLAIFLTLLGVCLVISTALAASLWSLMAGSPAGKATLPQPARAAESTGALSYENEKCSSGPKLVCPGVALKAPDDKAIFKGID